MTPQKFSAFVRAISVEMHFPRENIILGGDHLGPNVWQKQPADKAMEKAKVQIKAYVQAGFNKIHLDTSMPLGGDTLPLKTEISAERAAQLCEVAESAWQESPAAGVTPVYVIGTEVPVPGGAQEKLETIQPTSVSDVQETLEVTKNAFEKKRLTEAWKRVIAVVVQPGVEFSDDSVVEYDSENTGALSAFIKNIPQIVYEAHSTDYQTEAALTKMVEDHFAVLKVGPWLTFALREAVFALAKMEDEWIGYRKDVDLSHIIDVIEREMLNNPEYWKKHYQGGNPRKAFARRYSYSDRVRYYWTNEIIRKALQQLLDNLTRYPVPYSLISQFLPDQYAAIRRNELTQEPLDLIHHKIRQVLGIYARATGMAGKQSKNSEGKTICHSEIQGRRNPFRESIVEP